VQDLGGWQDDHADKDVEESHKRSGQDAPACRCIGLSRSFWDDVRNGTAAEKLQFVIRQLTVATARCRITILELPLCEMKGQKRSAGVLTQCPALAHLDISHHGTGFGFVGGKRGNRVRAS
jgi:hypothetical protein